ncbi:MAG: SPOR domain-containing protein [Sideroxydans sp.]
MKWLTGILVAANLAFFAWMEWGVELWSGASEELVQPPLHADKISIVASVPAAASAASAVPAVSFTLATELETPIKSGGECLEWGEFSGQALAAAQAEIAKLNLGQRVNTRTVEHDSGYWVYIPPLADATAVRNKIEQLKKRGVEEYFVVQEEGEWHNAISLGVFRSEAAAQRQWERLRQQAVHSARMGPRTSRFKLTLFDFNRVDEATLPRLRELAARFPDSELRSTECH